ncbi:MAG: PAS domain-containing sensor histidine kinase [Polyangiaceae bacterium]
MVKRRARPSLRRARLVGRPQGRARSKLTRRLIENEGQLRLFIEHAPAALAMFDREMRYLHASHRWLRDYGLVGRDLRGLSHYEVFPEIPERWREVHRRGLEGEVLRAEVDRFVRADGEVLWLRWEVRPYRDAGGAVAGIVIFTEDITELCAAQEALREADRRKDAFLATLSHELRNPLFPVAAGLQTLKRAPPGSPSAERAREIIERQVSHLVRLIDDLLDVSRIARGKLALRRERIELSAVVEHALEASRPLLARAGHLLTVHLPRGPVWLDGDLVRLAQVVCNLLNNASKYTPDGGHIELSAQVAGGEAALSVSDDGMGIPAEMLPRVFDMFAQVNRTLHRSQGGLGIGLALTRQLVEMHGGRVTAESAGPDRGSRFTVWLPRVAPGEVRARPQEVTGGEAPAE